MENDKIIVVFGGSFNPPLNSHFSLAEQIVSEYENVEKIIFVPVNQKYQKKGLLEDIINNDRFLKENEKSFIQVKNNVRSGLSSSFVREKIKEGKSIRYFTPDEVYSYIKANNLFK